jgi:AcrR family transcriptional regulator
VDAGLELFLQNGYEETTLDNIAVAAGISRRTFFSYFDSKEEILQAAQAGGFVDALRTAFAGTPAKDSPLEAARKALSRLVSRFETKESLAIDRLVQASETLRARKPAVYMQMEQNLFDALRGVWSEEAQERRLRIIAMVSIGIVRLAIDTWRQEHGKRSLAAYVRDGFAALKSEF